MLNFIAASAFVCRLSFKRAELTRAVKRKDTSAGDFIRAALEQLPVKPARVGTAQRRRCPKILPFVDTRSSRFGAPGSALRQARVPQLIGRLQTG